MPEEIDWGLLAAHVRAWVDSGGNFPEWQARTRDWHPMGREASQLFRRIITDEDLDMLDGLINLSIERSLRLKYK